jgi:ketosteroid isomerase-like protein
MRTIYLDEDYLMTMNKAAKFAEDWIDAWNCHDLSRILSHYSEGFEMSSPGIAQVMNEPSGRLKGKDKVRAYWAKSLAQSPSLRFELREVLVGTESVVVYYNNLTRQKMAAEVFIFDSDDKVEKSMAHYNCVK